MSSSANRKSKKQIKYNQINSKITETTKIETKIEFSFSYRQNILNKQRIETQTRKCFSMRQNYYYYKSIFRKCFVGRSFSGSFSFICILYVYESHDQ